MIKYITRTDQVNHLPSRLNDTEIDTNNLGQDELMFQILKSYIGQTAASGRSSASN
jgi:hypothetical protein